MNERHALLRAELAAQDIQLCVTPHVLLDDRASGAGLLDALTVTWARNGAEPHDLIGTLFKPLPEMHARHGQTHVTGSFAVPVDSWDEAQAEADRYDPVPIFASYLLQQWRSSMPPWAYYPAEATAGPHPSYGHYRIAMIRGNCLGRGKPPLGGLSWGAAEFIGSIVGSSPKRTPILYGINRGALALSDKKNGAHERFGWTTFP